MQVVHPQMPYNGVPAEDVFIALDDLGNQQGIGYLIYQYMPNAYPDCPVNIYFTLDGRPAVRYLLFGALMARARQMRDANPNARAWVYTSVDPQDSAALEFYAYNGFRTEDAELLLELTMPADTPHLPMSCSLDTTPLNTPEDRNALLLRLRQNDISYVDASYLYQLQGMPHFHAMGMFRNGRELVGECLLAGRGDACEAAALYVTPESRRQGLGEALLRQGMHLMRQEGVRRTTVRIMSRSVPQRSLMRIFAPRELSATMRFPGLAI